MTKMKSCMAAKFPKTSGKLNYFCSHTVFLEAAVSQQGDLLLRQQFGPSPSRNNITKLRRNYPPLIGLARPFQNRNIIKVAGMVSPAAAWQGLLA